jgi:hypothetical protein
LRLIVLVVALLVCPTSAICQTLPAQPNTVHQGHLWLQVFNTIKLSDRWTLQNEVQARRAEFGLTWQTLLFKTTPMYRVNDYISVGAGYSLGSAWPYGKQPAASKVFEQRVFEQLNARQKVGSVPLEHRVRLEQRFVRRVDQAGTGPNPYVYANRVRYRGGTRIPIHRIDAASQHRGDAFFYVNDEVFFSFGRNVPRQGFDQNRFAAGIGYQLSSESNIQTGYLHQYIKKSDGVRAESNHTLTIAFTYDFSLR